MTDDRDVKLLGEALIAQTIRESVAAQQKLLDESVNAIAAVAGLLVAVFKRGGKVLICGNGGSAADAQHVAAELVGRFKMERAALPAIALTTDTSILTSVGNDYSFEQIFARQVRALATASDVVIGISTSGKSPNVVAALKDARMQGAATIGVTGSQARVMADLCDVLFRAPSDVTARVQECHILAWHAICDVVERELFGKLP